MLYRTDHKPFATGKTTYYDFDLTHLHRQSAIYLRTVLSQQLRISMYALVDSGAPYCLFDRDIAVALGWDLNTGEPAKISTRVGQFSGAIQRLPIILAAEEGNSLEVEASVFVSSEWRFGHFLGYGGFLERFQFAVEPATNTFFFGPGN